MSAASAAATVGHAIQGAVVEDVRSIREAWSRELLRKHPAGLPNTVDFANDGEARLAWAVEGWIHYSKLAWAQDRFDGFDAAGRAWSGDFHSLTSDEKGVLAASALADAAAVWRAAKAEADRRASELQAARAREEAAERELSDFAARVRAERSARQLEAEYDRLREDLAAARNGANAEKRDMLDRKLSLLRDAMVVLERRAARAGYMFGWAGLIVGVISILVSIALYLVS